MEYAVEMNRLIELQMEGSRLTALPSSQARLAHEAVASLRRPRSTLELPQFKGTPGWEFTDISKLDLDSFGRASRSTRGRRSSTCPRMPRRSSSTSCSARS